MNVTVMPCHQAYVVSPTNKDLTRINKKIFSVIITPYLDADVVRHFNLDYTHTPYFYGDHDNWSACHDPTGNRGQIYGLD